MNSKRATQFRQWATQVLHLFAIKGYVLDRKRLENGTFLGQDYFEQLLAEIREIRLSERHFYQKITDINAISIDYNKDASTTREFFAKVQNKLHYAIHGHTVSPPMKDIFVKKQKRRDLAFPDNLAFSNLLYAGSRHQSPLVLNRNISYFSTSLFQIMKRIKYTFRQDSSVNATLVQKYLLLVKSYKNPQALLKKS